MSTDLLHSVHSIPQCYWCTGWLCTSFPRVSNLSTDWTCLSGWRSLPYPSVGIRLHFLLLLLVLALGLVSLLLTVSPPHWAFPGDGKPRWPFFGSVSPPLSLTPSVLCFVTCFLCGSDHHWEKHTAVSAEVQVRKRKPSAELDTRGSIKLRTQWDISYLLYTLSSYTCSIVSSEPPLLHAGMLLG